MTILFFQITAALMMGWDYFIPKKWREATNKKLKLHFSEKITNLDNKVIEFIKSTISDIKIIVVSIFLVIYGVSILEHLNFITKMHYTIIKFIISLSGTLALLAGGSYLAGLIIHIINHILINTIFPRIILTFLSLTEKGPFSGIGFIFLLISFFMRYKKISIH